MTWLARNWRLLALGAALVAVLASYGATYRAGQIAARAACEARIGEAQRQALIEAAEATQVQRARADALEVANRNLQGIADDILSQRRDACPLDDDARSRVQSIRP